MKLIFILMIALVLTGCADAVSVQNCVVGEPVGFWFGLWHGLIAPFSFIGSLFNDHIAVYAVNNSGGWYNFGFLLGVGAFSSTSTSIK